MTYGLNSKAGKAIANYFGRSVRSVQDLEEGGLPVHRFQNRVWAYPDELQAFRASREVLPHVQAKTEPILPQPLVTAVAQPVPARRRFLLPLVLAGVFALGLSAAILWTATRPAFRPISSLEVKGNLLRVFDDRGSLAWTHAFDGPPLGLEPEQRSRIADIDGDGTPELLFLRYVSTGATILYCFRSSGKLDWQTGVGRSITDGRGNSVLSNYSTKVLAVLQRPRPDGGRIVLLNHHIFSWPSQIAVLDKSGKQVAEYWHPGWLMDLDLADIDGDGIEEILAGGVDDSYRDVGPGATLVVLDSGFQSSQGPAREGDARVVQGVPTAHPAAMLLFPEVTPTPVDRSAFAHIQNVRFIEGHFELRVADGVSGHAVHYQLDRRLAIVSITPSPDVIDAFGPTLRQAQEALRKVRTLINRFASPH